MKKVLLISVIALALFMSGCSTMQPARYSISVDNVQELKKYSGAKISVSGLNQLTDFSAGCRMMGPIEPADGMSFSQFISKALNDEFKMSGLYDETGIRLSGDIVKIEFSSTEGLTNGYWDLGLKLNSSNGMSMTVYNKYRFKSGFDAITACNATANALSPAVQDLIKATVSNPEFSNLIENKKTSKIVSSL